MDITLYEMKILRYIDRRISRRKSTGYITNAELYKKFGAYSSAAIETLHSTGMIDCPEIIAPCDDLMPVSVPVSDMNDNWHITAKGKCCIADHRLVSCLTFREKLLYSIAGFISGALLAFISGFAAALSDHLFSVIIT